jgi:cellobiose phosphorylase
VATGLNGDLSIEKYGKFIDGDSCFELTAEPPRKWNNLHYNRYGETEIHCLASNIGDGTTTIRDPDGTTYELITYDNKYLYVRNETTGTVFCPGGAPVPTPVEDFSCRYYREKTVISGTCEGIRVSQTLFIPRDFINEIWSVQVENKTDKPQTVSLFGYAVFKLTGKRASGEPVGAGNASGNFSEVFPDLKGVLVTTRNQRAPTNRFKAYLATLDNYVGGCGYRDFFLRQDYSSAAPRILHGRIPHAFRPLSRKPYADQPCWALQTAADLIKESGDFALLNEVVPYFESNEKGTVWDHLIRGMRHLATDLGKNGLCDQRLGDWNDAREPTDEAGASESVMVTQQLCFGAREMAELARRIGDRVIEKEAGEIYKTFADRLNEVAWDGEWYVRTICADGYRIGSNANEEAKIFMNTQSWAVLAGIADAERAKLCMDYVEKFCKTDIGYKILWPAFTKYDPRTGMISNLAPNTQTNGG